MRHAAKVSGWSAAEQARKPGRWTLGTAQGSVPCCSLGCGEKGPGARIERTGSNLYFPPSQLRASHAAVVFAIPEQDGNRRPLPPWLVEGSGEVMDVEMPLTSRAGSWAPPRLVLKSLRAP